MPVTLRSGWARLFVETTAVGRLRMPPPGLLVLAGIGVVFLVPIASMRWLGLQDEHAYWAAAGRLWAGQPLYDPAAVPGTPFTYWYPPPLAQVLAPFTAFIPDLAFSLVWTALLLACLWFIADWRLLVGLALVAYLPVAAELWFRNVHLVIAALVVVALRRTPYAWIPAAAIKVTPVIGLGYLAAGGRWREALKVGLLGLAVLLVSVALSPGAWQDFLGDVLAMGGTSGSSLVPVPFVLRFAAAVALALAAGRLGGRRGESLLVVALVVGNPTLWATAFSLLAILVPVWHRPEPAAAPA